LDQNGADARVHASTAPIGSTATRPRDTVAQRAALWIRAYVIDPRRTSPLSPATIRPASSKFNGRIDDKCGSGILKLKNQCIRSLESNRFGGIDLACRHERDFTAGG
jgi:hypothetical protein